MEHIAEALAGLAQRLGVAAAAVPVTGGGRDAERAAGERAAADALGRAGLSGDTAATLGRAEDGRPLWPSGFTGSIAHTRSVAVAAAGRCNDQVAAVGIDVEDAAALPALDATVVLGDDERSLLARDPDPDRLATLLWSAKESAFKAWSHATDGRLGTVDPVDIAVAVDASADAVRVTARGALAAAVAPFGEAIGAYAEVAGVVLTLVVVAPPPGSSAG